MKQLANLLRCLYGYIIDILWVLVLIYVFGFDDAFKNGSKNADRRGWLSGTLVKHWLGQQGPSWDPT